MRPYAFPALEVLCEYWAFRIVREALAGVTRFDEFVARIGITRPTLSSRLAALVEQGILERREYRSTGQRARQAYVLTPEGQALSTVFAALQQWTLDTYETAHSTVVFRAADGRDVSVRFIDDTGQAVDAEDVRWTRVGVADDVRPSKGGP